MRSGKRKQKRKDRKEGGGEAQEKGGEEERGRDKGGRKRGEGERQGGGVRQGGWGREITDVGEKREGKFPDGPGMTKIMLTERPHTRK